MCIYNVTHPMRRKPIGKMHTTLGAAKRAALRAAKRPDLGHARVDHWRNGPVVTIFADGTEVNAAHKRASEASTRRSGAVGEAMAREG